MSEVQLDLDLNSDLDLDLDLQLASVAENIPSKDNILLWAQTALEDRLPSNQAEMTVRIVDEAEMTELNETYRKKSGPTNVLAFPFEVPEEVELNLIGDIVICAPVLEKEAKAQGKALRAHWAHIIIHGTLHLLGFDHITEEEAENMEGLEVSLLEKLGYPNPY